LPAATFEATLRWITPYVALLCAGTSALISLKIRSHSTHKLTLDRPLELVKLFAQEVPEEDLRNIK